MKNLLEENEKINKVNVHLHAENKLLKDLLKQDRTAHALERIANCLERMEDMKNG